MTVATGHQAAPKRAYLTAMDGFRRCGRRVAPRGFIALAWVFLMAPMAIIVPVSWTTSDFVRFPPTGFTLRWYDVLIADPTWKAALIHSLEVGTASGVIATCLGTTAAFAIMKQRRLRSLLEALLLVPLVVPTMVIAIGMYFTYTQWNLAGSALGLILAHACLGIPFVVITVLATLRRLDPHLEDAAAALGSSPIRAAWNVLVPLALPGVAAGFLFAFITSWDEIVVALFLTSPQFHTLPVEVWIQLNYDFTPAVAAVASVLFLATSGLLLIALMLQRLRATR